MDFIAAVEAALEANDDDEVCRLAGHLHEADLATIIEALKPDARSKLIALMRRGFDSVALTEFVGYGSVLGIATLWFGLG